jgi:hypothetical protein
MEDGPEKEEIRQLVSRGLAVAKLEYANSQIGEQQQQQQQQTNELVHEIVDVYSNTTSGESSMTDTDNDDVVISEDGGRG